MAFTGQLYIDGEWTTGSGGGTFETLDPSTGSVIGTAIEASAADVDAAVDAAVRAFADPAWRDMTPSARGKLLWRIADLIEQHADELGELESRDVGQVVGFARGSMAGAADMFRYFAGWTTKLDGTVSSISVPGYLHYTRREPVGVCALITPWNFPLAIAVWKLAPALATGNTVVLKPAEQTPLTTTRLVELVEEAGVPKGVVNLVTGGPEVGQALVYHPRVDKVSFTGSTEVGRSIVRASAGNLKRVSLELGGKAPNIVLKDADIDQAVIGSMLGGLFNSGQACAAYSRFYVDASRVDEFTDKLGSAMSNMKLGPGLAPDTQLGPLVSEEQLARVEGYVKGGIEQGAEVVLGGKRADGDLAAGFFFEPTLFRGVTHDMTIAREEIFGPVLPVISYDDPEELVAQANDTDYGLVACVWTKDVALGHRLAHGIRAGEVYINSMPMLDPAAPWGGFKASGWGREMAADALDAYTETKGIWVNLGG
ncbi:aldehyde dehydrogenase family protein [Microbacterium sp.]|jgi:aldehyde dehydrogenase (NAD+)/betaine-aldehyde dehydrogenase|uniref:aldehyde dehydrogenase family protein n=1 Tax=Microbacterium sp. TaxID=51671 RepID=UPI002C43834C|nr:aldehyde dehydrogenase family protein [Microbacterium sp.]HWL79043.1 aldehyde dehydrogenase family protein [Microbacterium sp.]